MQGADTSTRLFIAQVGDTRKIRIGRTVMRTKPVLYGDSLNTLQKAYPTQIVTPIALR